LTEPESCATIRRLLPHREPFLFVDRVVDSVPGVSCITLLRTEALRERSNPSLWILEAMGQTGAIAVRMSPRYAHKRFPVFVGMKEVEWFCLDRRTEWESVSVICEANLVGPERRQLGTVEVTAFVYPGGSSEDGLNNQEKKLEAKGRFEFSFLR